ncbi:MAG: carbon monoxide dehydrogenase [Desulfitibacter sp. BRH_c19]|nr:MAG: carbon monoxide dehydrogenase [Desulfitibacter sp. BRH_c19]
MPRFRDVDHTCRPSDADRVKNRKVRERTIDPAALELLEVAKENNIETTFDRFIAQQPQCKFGYEGLCCKFCMKGPCRIKALEGPGSRGICGASAWTIAARNVGLMIITGAASHSEHANHIAMALLEYAEGKASDYSIKDPEKLRAVAVRLDVDVEGKNDKEIAHEIAKISIEDLSRLKNMGESTWLTKSSIPERVEKFRQCNVVPHGIHATISDLCTQAHVGMDNDPVNIVFSAIRVALSDAAGEIMATEISDALFGTPKPVVTEANMGVLDKDKVNFVVHGHNPLLSDILVTTAREMEHEAIKAGAKGLNIVGMCCTGNEILMRQGIPILTSYTSQELAIVTGVCDAMVVDVQCIMPTIQKIAECYSTKIITTSDIVKIPGSMHIDYQVESATKNAKECIRIAIEAFKARKESNQPVKIPNHKTKIVSGFSLEALMDLFATVNSENPIKYLNNAIINGQLKGVILMAGCNNTKSYQDENHITIIKEMLKNDVLVLTTGCATYATSKFGLMDPDRVDEFCGEGLKKFIHAIEEKSELSTKLPPTFHVGSCVDNSRAYQLMMKMAEDLGVDTPKVPFVASAPEAMSGKATAIGSWLVAGGWPTHVGSMPPVEGSDLLYSILTQVAGDVYGGYFMFEMDPEIGAQKLLSALEYRNWKLKIHMQKAEEFQTPLCQNY